MGRADAGAGAGAGAGMGRAALHLWQGPRQAEIGEEKHDGPQVHLNSLRGPVVHPRDSQWAQRPSPGQRTAWRPLCTSLRTSPRTSPRVWVCKAPATSQSEPLRLPAGPQDSPRPGGGPALWRRHPAACCRLRPLEPGHRRAGAQSSLSPRPLRSGSRPTHPERRNGSDVPGTQLAPALRLAQGGGRAGRHPPLPWQEAPGG